LNAAPVHEASASEDNASEGSAQAAFTKIDADIQQGNCSAKGRG
jgi:hypothetical protein